MKITAGTLFLAVAVLLETIELISSEDPVQTTLAQLFPGYERSGELPPIRAINRNRETTTSTAFTQIGNHILRRPFHRPPFLARDHVIFAWMGHDRSGDHDRNKDYIAPLWQLFPSLEHEERWVFDTTRNHWVTLNENEFNKLGFGNIYALVLMQHSVALTHRLRTGNPVVDTLAHRIAYFRANNAIDILQATKAEELNMGQATFVQSADLIKTTYKETYDAVFRETARNAVHHM